jgi:hypothetical protein
VATGIDQVGNFSASMRSIAAAEPLADNAPLEVADSMIGPLEIPQIEEATIVEFKDEAVLAPLLDQASELEFEGESLNPPMEEQAGFSAELQAPMRAQYIPETQHKPGFFERMRNSLKGKPQSSAAPAQPQSVQPAKSTRVRPVETADLFADKNEEVSDVPAYLRRKG